MNFRTTCNILSPFILLAGCGGGSSGPSVTKWQGDSTHMAISGSFQTQAFEVDLKGATASGVYCNRFYAPLPGTAPDAAGKYDTSKVYFVMKELGAVIDLDGTPTEFTISYWRHDVDAGTKLTVVPRTFGTSIPAGQTWSDINLFMPGTDVLSGLESAASSGTVSMELNTGATDQNGILKPSGVRTGEYISVVWGPHDFLNISATSDCGPPIVVTWPQSRLSP